MKLGELLRENLAKLSENNLVRINEQGFDILVKCIEDTLRDYFDQANGEVETINARAKHVWEPRGNGR